MRYQTGKVGRCFVVQFEHGDAVLEDLVALAKKERIKCAVLYLVGGMKAAKIVVGPENEEMPPEPVWRRFDESHETMGVGTIFWQGDEPKIHVHGTYGKRDSVKMGCLRELAEAFIILEAVIIEIEGIEAVRELDPVSGMALLKLQSRVQSNER